MRQREGERVREIEAGRRQGERLVRLRAMKREFEAVIEQACDRWRRRV